ncbi:MAG: hypothetical protein KME31_34380 [Tolypothrix carrinoi HA7290-LM1]|jgi:hypothetical protein|nr:hypothetical protein [Tolypothrix carrinoi HA7290-LM1]
MIKIPYRLIRKLTCVLALAAVLVTSFVSPSYADNCHTFTMSAVSETAS